jgi:proteasome lid subunit RPN8/RPN11
MRIAQALLDEVIAHALEEAPNECCGMISARDGEAVAVHRTRNIHASPLRYEMDPNEQHRVQMGMEDEGLDLGAIYHSHTRSDPVPSQTDVNLAYMPRTDHLAFPGTLYLIVGVKDPSAPVVRAWTYADRRPVETPLEVV